MSVLFNNPLLGASGNQGGGGDLGETIAQSLRFSGSKLTGSTVSTSTWTCSFWIKFAVGDGSGAMQAAQCNAAAAAAPSEILAAEPAKDANSSRGFCSSARALAALLGNATELERLRSVTMCAVDGKAPKSTPRRNYLANARCGGFVTEPGRCASPKGAFLLSVTSTESQRLRED